MNRLLKGKKVWLRPPKTEDFEEFTAMNKASRKFHSGLANPPIDHKSFDGFLLRNEHDSNESFLICRRNDDAIAGMINLSQIFRGNFQNAYLGYYVGAKFAGKGFMTEAIDLILRFAFKQLKLHRIEANVQPQNLSSLTVLRKNGFTKEGFSRRYLKISKRWRDHERWAIIAEEWEKHLKSKKVNGK
jgi:ribosomal-protein-alanine N-acetyltransferase